MAGTGCLGAAEAARGAVKGGNARGAMKGGYARGGAVRGGAVRGAAASGWGGGPYLFRRILLHSQGRMV
eukprot:364478-Chlamydomonas_euryale.AAC.17